MNLQRKLSPRQKKFPAFRSEDFENFGGKARITVDDNEISIVWTTEKEWPELLEQAIESLQTGNYQEGILLLEILRSEDSENPDVLYNLGMALSDQDELERAEQCLRELVESEPRHINGQVALGVALQRQGKSGEAVSVLTDAVGSNPDNPWAHRNLGASLFSKGDFAQAEKHLHQAAELNPNDQQAWFGLGQVREKQGRDKDADEAYEKTIAADPHSDIAEKAREARTRFAHKSFQEKESGGKERFDAVMYCLDAMQKFDNMGESKVREVVTEIAIKGRSGLDMNDPDKEYSLRSLPGKFTGLHLVCMMYVGFQQINPDMDAGIDLSKEYQQAKKLYGEK